MFYNGFKPLDTETFQFINAKVVKGRLPNRLLNLGLRLGTLDFNNLAGGCDVLFMPNLNTVNLSLKSKLAITVHDMSPVIVPEFYDVKRKLWHKFLQIKKILLRADVIFTVSKYTKNDIIRLYGMDEMKIKVVYPGVDLKIFNPQIPEKDMRSARNSYSLPGKYFLFLNTIEPRKNLIGAVEAFEKANLDSHLVVAGKRGWKTGKIFRKLKNSAKKNRIHFLGYVKEEDKPAIIKMATGLLYPSFYEGFGFQALEAMAIGTPVIASQVTSLPEVVADAGLLINPYNLRDLVTAMENLEYSGFLKTTLVKKGLERARSFSWKESTLKTLAHLEEVAS